MRLKPSQRGLGLLAVSVAGLALAGGIAYATIPDSGGVIHTCFSQSKGTWRPIDSPSQQCKAGETPLDLYSKAGADSHFLGATAAAGGDLTGNYPNPTIGAGKVNSAKVLDDSLTGDDIQESSLGQVPSAANSDNADLLDGKDSSAFVQNGDAAGGDLNGTYPNPGVNQGPGSGLNADLLDGTDSSSLLLHCPSGTQRAVDVCYDDPQQAAATWIDAWLNCVNRSMRLPSVAEIGVVFRAIADPSVSESDWSDDHYDAGNSYALSLSGFTAGFDQHADGDSVTYRCVTSPRNNAGPTPTSPSGNTGTQLKLH